MQTQPITVQISAKTLLMGVIAAMAIVPITIFMTIWLLQPSNVSAGTFEQNANTGTTYQLPPGMSIVPSTSIVGGTCNAPKNTSTENTTKAAIYMAYGHPFTYKTGDVNQEQTETNTTTNTNIDNSVVNRFNYSHSFNSDSYNGNSTNSNNNEDSNNTEIDVDLELLSNNNINNQQSIIDSDDSENQNTEVEDAIGIIIANGNDI